MVSCRGQKKLEPHPDRSPLGVSLKISDTYHCPMQMRVPPPMHFHFVLESPAFEVAVADLGEGPSLFWVKKEEMNEGRKAGWASKIEPCPLLSSKSGSATGSC